MGQIRHDVVWFRNIRRLKGMGSLPALRWAPRGTNQRCAADYQSRLSGPLLDRVDTAYRGAGHRRRSRTIQPQRYGALGLVMRTNAQAAGTVLEQIIKPDPAGLGLLREASDAMRLSARGYHRVLRVARTLADLDGEDAVRRVNFAEALAYRGSSPTISGRGPARGKRRALPRGCHNSVSVMFIMR